MKKKLTVFLTGAVLCAALLFAATACSITSDHSGLRSAYNNVDEALKIVKTVQVLQGDILLSSHEETYEQTEEGYLYTEKERRLNEIGQGDGNSAYTDTETAPVTVSAENVSFGEFPANTAFKNAVFTEAEEGSFTMEATLADLSVLDLSADMVSGDVSASIEVSGEKFVSMEFSYTSSNSNAVTIAWAYTY